MRKSYANIPGLFLISSSFAFAQPGISTVAPKIGDSIVVASVTLTESQTADPGTAGTGKSWNFTSFSTGSTFTTSKYYSPGGMPGASYFPGATLAATNPSLINSGGGSISYMNTTSTGIMAIGLCSVISSEGGIIQNYTDPIYQDFPNLAYNGTFSDAMAGTQIIYPDDFKLYDIIGNVNYKYDAHGTLTYAFGTFSNVARINYTTTQTFNGVDDFEGQIVKNTSQNYAYYDLTSKQTLVAIITTTTTNYIENIELNSTTTSRVLIYKPSVLTALDSEKGYEKSLSIYPNPSKDNIIVNEAFKFISIRDNNGNALLTKDLHFGKEVNVSEFKNGIYFAELITEQGEKKCVKLIVIK